jgi:hypothetical protein
MDQTTTGMIRPVEHLGLAMTSSGKAVVS